MADFKRRTLILSSGKQPKLYGNSLAIYPSLEIGEGAAPNIFSFINQQHLPDTEENKSSVALEQKKKQSGATVEKNMPDTQKIPAKQMTGINLN